MSIFAFAYNIYFRICYFISDYNHDALASELWLPNYFIVQEISIRGQF